MKKFKRFKQSYRDTVNPVVFATRKHRAKYAYSLELGEMYEWANGFRSTAIFERHGTFRMVYLNPSNRPVGTTLLDYCCNNVRKWSQEA